MNLPALPHLYRGKVRDLYEVGHDRLLIVASDRISAFDVVIDEPIPDKGRVLTALSTFWFEATAHLAGNHLVSSDPTDFPETAGRDVAGRSMLVRVTRPVRLECIVRGYLFGSAWSEYEANGTVNGVRLPAALHQAERLPEPMFTPTTKADEGHDVPLTRDEGVALVGLDRYRRMEQLSITLYRFGAEHAAARGLLLADTKFEFGEIDDELLLIDELMTPDSSRYWPADEYVIGTSPPSFDKQYVRDFLAASGWNRVPPAPHLPEAVVQGTRARYVEAYEAVTGRSFDEWYGLGD
ncbi:MAG TPA: phosphoribosylaminoimidazolesuccinocarboxamide synthase [Acidimicrobiia bacterium]